MLASPWPFTTLAAVAAAVLCRAEALRPRWQKCMHCVGRGIVPEFPRPDEAHYYNCAGCRGTGGRAVPNSRLWHLAGALAVLVAAVAGYGWIAGRG